MWNTAQRRGTHQSFLDRTPHVRLGSQLCLDECVALALPSLCNLCLLRLLPVYTLSPTFTLQTLKHTSVARKKKVRGERVVDAIEESDRPFVTTTDIASHLDVTAQAVRNRADELERYPEITKGNVGQSSVYWLAEEDKPPEVTASTSDDSGSKGILNRWFAGLPSLGDSAEKWYLTTLLLVLVAALRAVL